MGLIKSFISKINPAKSALNSKEYKIAILTPDVNSITQDVQRGFVETIQKKSKLPVSYTIINTGIRKEKVSYDLHHIIQQNYSALFTIGCSCTKAAVSFMQNFEVSLPIVCVGIDQNIFKDGKIPSNVAGISIVEDQKEDQLRQLFKLSPSIKHILYLYDFQMPYFVNDTKMFDKITSEYQSFFSHLDSNRFNLESFKSYLRVAFPKIDTIVLNRDNMTLRVAPQIIELSNAYGIQVVTFDLATVKQGAAIGFGIDEKGYHGKESAEKTLLALEEKVPPNEIGLSPGKYSYKVLINEKTLQQQNVCINSNILTLLKHAEISKN